MIVSPDNDSSPQDIPWVDPDLWARRTSRSRDPATAVFDPIWRVANLYEIQDSDTGQFIPFVPKPEQRVILWDIYVRGIKNIIIPKARRLGCSTLLMIIVLDRMLFMKGQKCVLVDKTLTDAKKKLSDMARVAWDRMKPMEKKPFEMRANTEEMKARIRGALDDGWSTLRVTVSGRGGEAHFLVVSEWGTIQFEDPQRSNEIKTGAMVAANRGIRVIETTWKGGKGGDVYAYVAQALKYPEEEKSPKTDWYLRFFPWYLDKRYVIEGDYGRINSETHNYLDEREGELGITFTQPQRMWYFNEQETMGLMMKREFPTVLRECWTAPIEGSIYGAEMDKARTSGRVTIFPISSSASTDLFFDLGAPANTACWYIQHEHGRRVIVDYDAGLDVTLAGRCQHIKSRGYRIGTIYIPHDGSALQKGGVSYQKEFMAALREAGLPDRVVIVPRTRDVWLGINGVTTGFPTFHFHATNCAKGIECLDAYRRKPDPNREGFFLDEVVTDWCNHSADALRTFAEAKLAQFLPDTSEHVTTNSYFDPDVLHALAASAVPMCAKQKLGIVIQPDEGRTGLPKTFYADPGGHFRLWEMPRQGSYYIVTMTGKSLQVWRKSERSPEGAITPAAMVAACLPDERTQQGIMADWAADLSTIFGNCMVVADITSGPAWVAQLQASGTPIFIRKMAPQDKRAGTVKPVRKPGWEMTPDTRLQAFQSLQAALPELDIWCPHTLSQLGMIISGPNDAPVTLEGSHDDWAAGAAMAAHTLPHATLWQYAPLAQVTRPAWDHGVPGMAHWSQTAETGVLG